MSSDRNQGIRLPPISFLSSSTSPTQQQVQPLPPNKLTSPTNLGIHNFLNNPIPPPTTQSSVSPPATSSLSPPQSYGDHINKKLRTSSSPQMENSTASPQQKHQVQQSPIYQQQYTLPQINQRVEQPQQQQYQQQQVQLKQPPSQQPQLQQEQQQQVPVVQLHYSTPETPNSESQQTQKQQQQQQQQQKKQPIIHHHHHHHHHHNNSPHHHHHHHHPAAQAPPQKQQQQKQKRSHTPKKSSKEINPRHIAFKKRSPPKLNVDTIKLLIKELFSARHFLGTLIYNPTTTWDNLQTSQLYGLKPELQERFNEIKQAYISRKADVHNQIRYITTIPPLPSDYINSIIEIKIPFRYIIEFKQDVGNELFTRELWGGASGVYTDDSDILQVLMHLGLFNNTIDLSTWNTNWTVKDLISPLNMNDDKESLGIDKGVYGDLSVEIILLPSLPKYYGFFQNGINSRSWLAHNHHSGLSYAVYNVKWESKGSYLRDDSIFKKFELEVQQDQL